MNDIAADPVVAAEYRAQGWWGDRTLAHRVADLAAARPTTPAYITEAHVLSWGGYHDAGQRVAAALVSTGLERGDRVAVLLPDGPSVHAAFVGIERAGLVIVGIGARAGDREVRHLLGLTGAQALISHATLGDRPAPELVAALRAEGLPLRHHLVIGDFAADPDALILLDGQPLKGLPPPPADLARGPDELWLLNSTSGTTGLPKCVMHTQNRWWYFHQRAMISAEFTEDDIFFGAVPAPFGFGIWTAHASPTILGVPTLVTERFNADVALDLIERHRVTALHCVSTQFIMLLNAQAERPRDLSSLRCMFTGGEAVPYERAAQFEETIGAKVLQFYGSNETGLLTGTTMRDTRDRRLRTAGQIIDEMEVRLFDPETQDEVTGVGQPACRGPATCLGYWGDPSANAKLYTKDGWMLMGDIVEIDADGYLRVVGRTSDFIIRGGKNISAPAVEEEVGAYGPVAMVAAVAIPDPVFGERVCVYVVARPNQTVDLDGIRTHLAARGVTKEWWPEHLVLVEELPRSSGGKVAKGELREDIRRRLAADPAAN
jgi:acyl-CoA synthetase